MFEQFSQDQFSKSRSITQLQIKLVSCRQGYNESVRVFADRIENRLNDRNDASQGQETAEISHNLNFKSAFNEFPKVYATM